MVVRKHELCWWKFIKRNKKKRRILPCESREHHVVLWCDHSFLFMLAIPNWPHHQLITKNCNVGGSHHMQIVWGPLIPKGFTVAAFLLQDGWRNHMIFATTWGQRFWKIARNNFKNFTDVDIFYWLFDFWVRAQGV